VSPRPGYATRRTHAANNKRKKTEAVTFSLERTGPPSQPVSRFRGSEVPEFSRAGFRGSVSTSAIRIRCKAEPWNQDLENLGTSEPRNRHSSVHSVGSQDEQV
jgi:hypothetical protein